MLTVHGRFFQMLFTWDTTNLCIIFSSWHIRSTAGLLFSLLAVVLIGMGYEALRAGTRRYEVVMRRRMDTIPSEFHSSYIRIAQQGLSLLLWPWLLCRGMDSVFQLNPRPFPQIQACI